MKKSELIALYDIGRRDFNGEDLRGQCFQGENLAGINLSGANVCGANFVDANLNEANFTGIIAGSNLYWTIVQFAFGFFLLLPLTLISTLYIVFIGSTIIPVGRFSSTVGVAALFTTCIFFLFRDELQKEVWIFLNVETATSDANTSWVIFSFATKLMMAFPIRVRVAISICFFIFLSLLLLEPFRNSLSSIITPELFLHLGTLIRSVINSEISIQILSHLGVAVATFFILCIFFFCGFILALPFSMYLESRSTVFIVLMFLTIPLFVALTLSSIVSGIVCLLGEVLIGSFLYYLQPSARYYKARKARYPIISVPLFFSSIGCTSFRRASLIGADFSQARLFGADFRQAQLSYVSWQNVKQLESAQLAGTYLDNLRVRELVTTRNGNRLSSHWERVPGALEAPVLASINLRGFNLEKVNFHGVHLDKAKLNEANLKGAILSKSQMREVDLRRADLKEANLKEADLRGADLREADLRGADLREADLRGVDMRRADLRETNLSGFYFSELDLSGTDLRGADLSRTQALGTIFKEANFTGACIEDWNINSATDLQSVECDYIYLRKNCRERRPHGRTFKVGEFTQRFQQFLDTVDLFFVDGVDWKAFLASFQDLQSQYGDDNVVIQGFERKGHSSFEVRIAVSPEVDKAEIERVALESYEVNLKRLEAQYREQLAVKDGEIHQYRQKNEFADELIAVYRRQNSDLTEIAKLAASRHITVEAKAVAEQRSGTHDLRGAQFAGGYAETVQGNQVGGTINNYGASLNNIISLITSLREQAQTFPSEQKDEALDVLDDIELDIQKPQLDQNRTGRRLKRLAAVAVTVGTITGGAATFSGNITEFASNVSELANTLGISIEQIQPSEILEP